MRPGSAGAAPRRGCTTSAPDSAHQAFVARVPTSRADAAAPAPAFVGNGRARSPRTRRQRRARLRPVSGKCPCRNDRATVSRDRDAGAPPRHAVVPRDAVLRGAMAVGTSCACRGDDIVRDDVGGRRASRTALPRPDGPGPSRRPPLASRVTVMRGTACSRPSIAVTSGVGTGTVETVRRTVVRAGPPGCPACPPSSDCAPVITATMLRFASGRSAGPATRCGVPGGGGRRTVCRARTRRRPAAARRMRRTDSNATVTTAVADACNPLRAPRRAGVAEPESRRSLHHLSRA